MANRNASRYCLSHKELLLSSNSVEQLIIGFGVPPLVLLGVIGNCVNLTVLISMKSRSNTLLAALALCDTAFLVFMLPHCLAHYKMFAFDNAFRRIYFATKIHLIALLNWASAAAIWLVLLICVERFVAIRYPLNSRRYGSSANCMFIAGIICATGLLTVYNHVSYDCMTRTFCNGTQLHSFCLPVDSDLWPANMTNAHSTLLRRFVRFSPLVNALFVVFVPTTLVFVSNILLIRTLSQRKKFLKSSSSAYSIKQKRDTVYYDEQRTLTESKKSLYYHRTGEFTNTMATTGGGLGLRRQQMRTEQKVTLTVCAIVTCFTITQSPSAIVALATGFVELKDPIYHVYMRTLTTFMVVLGKSLNFLFFCLSSANFRRRLVTIFKTRFCWTHNYTAALLPAIKSKIHLPNR